MNYEKLALETIHLIETEKSLKQDDYSLFNLAMQQIELFLKTNQYVIINEFQKKLLANSPLHLLKTVEMYTKSLAHVTLAFEYEEDFRSIINKEIIEININKYGRKGTPHYNALLRIHTKLLEEHLKFLYEEGPLKSPYSRHLKTNNYCKTFFKSQEITENKFHILKSIMDHNIPASIVYFEY